MAGNSLTIDVSREAKKLFPEFSVCGVKVLDYNKAVSKLDYHDLQTLVDRLKNTEQRPELRKSWRFAFGAMGLKPSKFPSSVEALAKRAAKGEECWRTAIPAVDFYNAISVRHFAPIGGYDIDKFDMKNISIRPIWRDCDKFSPIGGHADIAKGNRNLLVYACGNEILCWALNHRDSKLFCLDDETVNARS
ncbi:MAG: phenylalanine--tRNA ligase beta subunit-related protein [Hyphomicrobiales bacterium]